MLRYGNDFARVVLEANDLCRKDGGSVGLHVSDMFSSGELKVNVQDVNHVCRAILSFRYGMENNMSNGSIYSMPGIRK